MVALLIGFVWLQTQIVQATNLFLVLTPLIAAAAILWSLIPRWDRFVAPGARLRRADQPRLFALLDEVARATRQRTPGEVYLTLESNAWVTRRGGVLGLFSRK